MQGNYNFMWPVKTLGFNVLIPRQNVGWQNVINFYAFLIFFNLFIEIFSTRPVSLKIDSEIFYKMKTFRKFLKNSSKVITNLRARKAFISFKNF